jgi:hypothetical protein
MEETPTVHRLHLPMPLRKTMASTNVIESAFLIVEQVCRNVKLLARWRSTRTLGGSSLLVAEKQLPTDPGLQADSNTSQRLESMAPVKPQLLKHKKAS